MIIICIGMFRYGIFDPLNFEFSNVSSSDQLFYTHYSRHITYLYIYLYIVLSQGQGKVFM